MTTRTARPTAPAAEQKGYRFLHRSWKNPRFSLAEVKSLPAEQTAQEFIVTRVARGVVHYRAVYRHGDREELGARWMCNVGELCKYILKEVTP